MFKEWKNVGFQLCRYSRHNKLSLRCWCLWRLSLNRLTINATTHTFPEISFRDLSENVWIVALIVYRFRDNRQNHRRLNSYRGDYTVYSPRTIHGGLGHNKHVKEPSC